MMKSQSLPSANHLLLSGILLAVLGLVAVAARAFVGETVVWIIGVLLLLAGIVQFYQGWKAEKFSEKAFPMLMGVLAAVLGGALLGNSVFAGSILTIIFVVIFAVEGIWKILISLSFRQAKGWIALLISGLLSFLLAYLIWRGWPDSGLATVGILIGINLLVTGASMIIVSITLKQVANNITGS